MSTVTDHSAIAVARADRTANYLRANADVLTRRGINVNSVIDGIYRAAHAGDPAYVALGPIVNLGNRLIRISDRLTGTVVRRGGRDITATDIASPDGDALAEIATNLVTSIPADSDLYLCRSAS